MIDQKSNVRGKKICWISFLVLDKDLHKTSQIEILKSLAERGHQTSLFGTYSNERFESKIKNVQVISIPLRYISLLTALMYTVLLFISLPFYLAFSKTDYVIIEPQSPVFISLIPTRLFPKSRRPKVVLDIRTTPVDGTQTGQSLFKLSIYAGKKLFDGMTIITPMMRTEVCNQFQIDSATMGVWPSGVSTTLFNPENYDRTALRKASDIDDKFVVFYHGSIGQSYDQVQARGLVESIKSIQTLKKRHPDLVLYMLGDSRSFYLLKKLITKYDVHDRVILHDKVSYEDVPKYIAMCDLALIPFDLPIWRNQCPLKLLEYCSMEKVIIVTDIPAHRYILGTCKSAVFIPASSAEEIANAISHVHENVGSLQEGSRCGRAIIEEKYSWPQVAASFEKYLLELDAKCLNFS